MLEDSDRQELKKRLKEIDASGSVPELYEGAVQIIVDTNFPAEAKVRFVAHAAREICTRLPSIVSGKTIERIEIQKTLKELKSILKLEGLENFQYAENLNPSVQNDLISVSPILIEKVHDICKLNDKIDENRVKKAEALITELVPEHKHNTKEIIPLINEFKKLEDYFQKHTHLRNESAKTDTNELQEKFYLLENFLHSLCGYFYSGYEKIRQIIKEANETNCEPDQNLVNRALVAMGTPQFLRYFYENIKSPYWLEALREKGCFKNPPDAEKVGNGTRYRHWPQGKYLVAMAEKKPEQVLEIINGIETDNVLVMRDCFQVLGAMPLRVVVQGMGLVRRFLEKEDIYHEWFSIGELAAELMVKLSEEGYADEAFWIAEKLLAVEIKESKHFRSWHDLEGKFLSHEYDELVFKYFKPLWEKDKQGFRIGKLLIDILDQQIEIEKKRKETETVPPELAAKWDEILKEEENAEEEEEDSEEYDPTEHSYITMPSLAKLGTGRDIAETLVAAICQIGQYLMENEDSETTHLLQFLGEKRKNIFDRIRIHVLQYAKNDSWMKDIETILANENYYANYRIAAEFKDLLVAKWEDISGPIKEQYISWAEGQEIDDVNRFKEWFVETRKREPEPSDIDAYNHYLKAQALYCVKDKGDVREKYQMHLRESKREEDTVKPRDWGAVETYSPSSPEYSPMSLEEMQIKSPKEVIDYIRDYDSKHDDKKEINKYGFPVDRKGALSSALSNDLKNRMAEYLEVDISAIIKLSHIYIRDILYAVRELIQNKSIEGPDCDKILELCQKVYDLGKDDLKYREAMITISRIFEPVFKGDHYKEIVNPDHLQAMWAILASLLDYKYDLEKEEEEEENTGDAFEKGTNRVGGVALENIISFGLFCKNHKRDLYDNTYSVSLKEKLQHVLDNIERREILCVLGVFFVNLCWLEGEWVQGKVNQIFPGGDEQKWRDIWGSYLRWSRPIKLSFEIARGKYLYAVEKVEKIAASDKEEDYSNRLMEHVMLAYWQGWTGLEENGLVRKMLDKMDDAMKGEAAHWLATGFGYLKEHGQDEWKEGVIKRLRDYWGLRYQVMEKEAAAHREEANEFAGWVKDSPLEADETMALAEKAVRLAGGITGRNRGIADFVEGIYAISEGRELRVLELLLYILEQAIGDPNREIWEWQYERTKEILVKFMDGILELKDDTQINEIRKTAKEVADILGRMGCEYLEEHYRRLAEKE